MNLLMQRRPGFSRFKRSSSGFVLIELVVVVGLLIFLFGIYWSRTSVNFQKQQQAACRQNLQTIYVALQAYALENKDRFPSDATAQSSEAPLSLLIPKYTSRTDLFICPGTKGNKLPQGESFRNRRISYAYLSGLTTKAASDQWIMADALINTIPYKVGDLIFSGDGKKPGNNHDKYGGVVMFADGRVEMTKTNSSFSLNNPPGTKILNPSR